jgi:hypothetical protein
MARAKKDGRKRRNRKNLLKNIQRIQQNEMVLKSLLKGEN